MGGRVVCCRCLWLHMAQTFVEMLQTAYQQQSHSGWMTANRRYEQGCEWVKTGQTSGSSAASAKPCATYPCCIHSAALHVTCTVLPCHHVSHRQQLSVCSRTLAWALKQRVCCGLHHGCLRQYAVPGWTAASMHDGCMHHSHQSHHISAHITLCMH